ncbi:MAG: HIT domain-containing protein [Pseudomonadota bacterium]|nr:HIT domain-containing protein [Pseudomonadota bacterium]
MTATFNLDPRLAGDSTPVGDWPLSAVRLYHDSRWPWLLLVPRRAGAVELFDLQAADRAQLVEEAAAAARVVAGLGPCDKTNVATLGNMVPQMHVHVIARQKGDPAWPGPVWGVGTAVPYGGAERDALVSRLRVLLGREFSFLGPD